MNKNLNNSMRKLIFIALMLIGNQIIAQNSDCKVLVENLQGFYKGGCKNGLANGKGYAKGIDEYNGKFKNGYPNGRGKYTWKDGSYFEGNWREGKREGRGKLYSPEVKKAVYGIWENDVFIKEITLPPYEITQQTGITGVNIQEKPNAQKGTIEIVFSRDGSESRSIGGLMISSTSGNIKTLNYLTAIENAEFPIKIDLQFSSPNRFNTTLINYYLKFKINKESSWRVVIRY